MIRHRQLVTLYIDVWSDTLPARECFVIIFSVTCCYLFVLFIDLTLWACDVSVNSWVTCVLLYSPLIWRTHTLAVYHLFLLWTDGFVCSTCTNWATIIHIFHGVLIHVHVDVVSHSNCIELIELLLLMLLQPLLLDALLLLWCLLQLLILIPAFKVILWLIKFLTNLWFLIWTKWLEVSWWVDNILYPLWLVLSLLFLAVDGSHVVECAEFIKLVSSSHWVLSWYEYLARA